MKYILLPEDVAPESAVGGKARALAELTLAQLPVPEWFVVIPTAFDPSAATVRLAPEAARELEAGIAALGSDTVFAVRSSALDEDSARLSFAGQLESFLGVARGDVAARVLDVYASGFSERLLSYRRTVGAEVRAGAPAVIVQRMIEGDTSGVAFSADPVSGRRAVAVVAAVPGLANALVSGEAEADTWRVDREGHIVERHIEAKRVKQRRSAGNARGIETVATDREEALKPALDDEAVVLVAELARRAARHFGRPQDIEWTLAAGRLYVLQSRPITTLVERPDPDAVRALWDNSNIVESYAGITTPLTFSFARRAYEHVYREFCRLVRVPERTIAANGAMFCCMLGLMRGRVYYNLFNWYRLVALLPGYRSNRRFMEQMMGVRESLPDDVAAAQGEAGKGERLQDAWRLAVSLGALIVHLITLPRRMARFQERLRLALGSGHVDLSGLRPEELVRYYRDLEQQLLVHWDAPIVNDFATMLFHGLLRRLTGAWLQGGNESVHNDLLCAEPGMISEEPARRVQQMAALAAQDARVVALLCDGALPAIGKALAGHAALQRAIDDYLERFGMRCMEELKLESCTLLDDPTPLYRAIGGCAASLAAERARTDAAGDVSIRREAEARVAAALAGHPVRRVVYAAVLKATRGCVRARENLRFERTRVFGRARQIVVALGSRLAEIDCLADPRDVFYLELDELLAFVEARATTVDLQGLVEVRKREFARYREAPAPADRFETRGIAYRGHDFTGAAARSAPSGQVLQGLGCCAGIVRGPVRIVSEPRKASIRHGEIIVAERTDPGWVMIFPAAAGLLVERGSLLSHSAIVARELGLPAIVSLAGLTQWVRDGDWVEMDGASGKVVKLEAADGPADIRAA